MDIKVAIFEDRKPVREAISLLVEGTPGLALAGAWPDCSRLVENLAASNPDLVLMDIEMPGMNGVEAVKVVKQHFPQLTVVMQTVFEEDDKVFDAVCNGASGYLLKDTPPARLMESIIEAYHGGAPMSPSIASKVLRLFQKHLSPTPDSSQADYHLTNREKEILQGLVNGFSYKMIADHHKISFDTVRTHVRNIYEKLHVASSSQAVAKAIREKLV